MFSRTSIVLASSLVAVVAAVPSYGDMMANWTFETSGPALTLNDSMASPSALAEAGIYAGSSFATGLHASALTDWSSPAGNGSIESFSANTWAVGDYWQFSTSSTGYENITIGWDQTGSNTGPRDFSLQYSTDGLVFTDIAPYMMAVPIISWSSGAPVAGTSYFADLSGITALNDAAAIFFRFTMTSTVAINLGVVAAGGTNRVDNVLISADAIPSPGALALLGLAAMSGRNRRRR